jgi:hypothetical protein
VNQHPFEIQDYFAVYELPQRTQRQNFRRRACYALDRAISTLIVCSLLLQGGGGAGEAEMHTALGSHSRSTRTSA